MLDEWNYFVCHTVSKDKLLGKFMPLDSSQNINFLSINIMQSTTILPRMTRRYSGFSFAAPSRKSNFGNEAPAIISNCRCFSLLFQKKYWDKEFSRFLLNLWFYLYFLREESCGKMIKFKRSTPSSLVIELHKLLFHRSWMHKSYSLSEYFSFPSGVSFLKLPKSIPKKPLLCLTVPHKPRLVVSVFR